MRKLLSCLVILIKSTLRPRKRPSIHTSKSCHRETQSQVTGRTGLSRSNMVWASYVSSCNSIADTDKPQPERAAVSCAMRRAPPAPGRPKPMPQRAASQPMEPSRRRGLLVCRSASVAGSGGAGTCGDSQKRLCTCVWACIGEGTRTARGASVAMEKLKQPGPSLEQR
jgi:hypothetical protein